MSFLLFILVLVAVVNIVWTISLHRFATRFAVSYFDLMNKEMHVRRTADQDTRGHLQLQFDALTSEVRRDLVNIQARHNTYARLICHLLDRGAFDGTEKRNGQSRKP